MPAGGAYQYLNTSSVRLKGARQRHQNTLRFNPHRHNPENALPPQVTRMMTSLCCRRCNLILRWKHDYGKYPSIVTIRKTVRSCCCCHEKTVAIPFHRICQECARELGVCAKCSKTPEESEQLADAARMRPWRNECGDEDEHDAAASHNEDEEEEEEDETDEEDDDDDEEAAMRRAAADEADAETAAARAAKKEEDRLRQEQDEIDFPELARLRGLDLSVLRSKLYEERQASATSALTTQGKMRERDRRTARRLLSKGDESGAAHAIAAAVANAAGMNNYGRSNDSDDDAEATGDKKEAKPQPKQAVVVADATSSDEETI